MKHETATFSWNPKLQYFLVFGGEGDSKGGARPVCHGGRFGVKRTACGYGGATLDAACRSFYSEPDIEFVPNR